MGVKRSLSKMIYSPTPSEVARDLGISLGDIQLEARPKDKNFYQDSVVKEEDTTNNRKVC